MENIKWRALVGLVCILIAVVFEITWLWGLIIIAWALPDIFSGHTHLFEPVSRTQNPITFWLITLTWMISGFFLIFVWR